MHYTVIPARELDNRLAAIWMDILDRNPEFNNPYFTPHFTRAVAGVRDDAWLTILEEDDGVAGFFPFQRAYGCVGRPVGGAFSDYQAVIVGPDAEWTAEDLLRGSRLRVWEFDHLVAWQRPFQAYHQAVTFSPVAVLAHGFEHYNRAWRDRGSRELLEVCRLRRKLEREVGALRFCPCETEPRVLGQIIDWKRLQYARSGFVDAFEFPWTGRLLQAILETRTPEFSGMMAALYAGGQLVAGHMGMRTRDVLHHWFPSYDRAFARYSPGIVLLLYMLETAGDFGVTAIDFGKGDEAYKRRLATASVSIAEGRVELPSLARSLRTLRRTAETAVRQSPLRAVARIPGRLVRRLESRRHFR